MASAVTKAVSKFGKRSGEPRQLSRRNTKVVPGRSNNCWALNTRLARRAVPMTAKRVPSPSVKATS